MSMNNNPINRVNRALGNQIQKLPPTYIPIIPMLVAILVLWLLLR